MKQPMKLTTIKIDDNTLARLHMLADERKMTVAGFVRELSLELMHEAPVSNDTKMILSRIDSLHWDVKDLKAKINGYHDVDKKIEDLKAANRAFDQNGNETLEYLELLKEKMESQRRPDGVLTSGKYAPYSKYNPLKT